MGERLVVRWTLSSMVFKVRIAPMAVALAAFAVRLEGTRQVVSAMAAAALSACIIPSLLRAEVVLDSAGMRVNGLFRGASLPWDDVVALRWRRVTSQHTGNGWSAHVMRRDGAEVDLPDKVLSDRWVSDVNEWLRANQPEVLIDPSSPWRDRFGDWHVAEPEHDLAGHDPVETMMSLRRSLIGPWEIVARTCEGGYRAEQRLVRGGEVVAQEPVRERLAEAKSDGVRLVRAAVVAASSAHE